MANLDVQQNNANVLKAFRVALALAAINGILKGDGEGNFEAAAVPIPSASVPQMDGAASAGTSDEYARADHVHPKDTAIPQPSAATPLMDGTAAVGTSDAFARADHRHPSMLNRNTAVNAADTSYTTLMARGESLNAAEVSPGVNGAIAWVYE